MGEKDELRKTVRRLKNLHTKDELRELSAKIAESLLGLSRLKEAQTVMLYCSLPDEVYTMDIIHSLSKAGKRIVLPRVTGDSDMELREYTGDADLTPGSFGIPEPCGKVFDKYDRIDVAVIPGMAFDIEGNRLGRGKGYYDRFLKCNRSTYKIGLCFDFQFMDRIPAYKHDIRMDCVIHQ